jgi:hypothetical protein
MMLLTTISFVTYAKAFLTYVRNDSILVSWSCYFILDWFLITLEFWTIVIQGKMPKNNANFFFKEKKKCSEVNHVRKYIAVPRRLGSSLGQQRLLFLVGRNWDWKSTQHQLQLDQLRFVLQLTLIDPSGSQVAPLLHGLMEGQLKTCALAPNRLSFFLFIHENNQGLCFAS